MEKVMQKTLTAVSSLEGDYFANDAVEEAEKTDNPLSSGSIGGRTLCSLRFADDIDLLGSSTEKNSTTHSMTGGNNG